MKKTAGFPLILCLPVISAVQNEVHLIVSAPDDHYGQLNI
jgi:hypothetical protein